jgi:hypothetical protein
MAIRFTDGFDLYTGLAAMGASRNWIYDGDTTDYDIATTAGKYGGGALEIKDSPEANLYHDMTGSFSSSNLICISFLFRTASATKPTSNVDMLIGVADGGTTNDTFVGTNADYPCIGVDPFGRMGISKYGIFTSIYATVSINVCDGLWHHIEAAFQYGSSTGILQIYVDGSPSPLNITSGNVIGTNATSNPLDRIVINNESTQQSNWYIDDLIVWDNTSSGIPGDLTYSDFPLGEVRIETIQPNGVGTNSGWTPLSGDNYTNVDEAVADGDTSYVSTGTATDLDTYAFSNLSGTPNTIYGVNIGSLGKASPGATTNIRHYTLSSGTANESSDITLNGGAYQFNQTFVGQDPNTTAAWTASGINAAEFGIEKQ